MPKPTTNPIRNGFLAALLATLSTINTACVTNPATGRDQINYLSKSAEIRLGQQAAQQAVPAYGGELQNTAINQYVDRVGNAIAQQVEPFYQDLPWEFTVLDTPDVNAFALPGGKIFITRGLLAQMNSEAELAGVMGHEVAHVTAEHHDLAAQRQLALAGVSIVGAITAEQLDSEIGTVAAQAFVTGAGLFALSYDRRQEHESDKLGLRYMTAAGYNPNGLLSVMQTLDRLSPNADGTDWTSTHPNPGDRAQTISTLIDQRYADLANSPDAIIGAAAYQSTVLNNLN